MLVHYLARSAGEASVLTKIYLLVLVLCPLSLTSPSTVEAQVIKIRDLAFGPAQRRKVAFSKALSSTNDLLSFIASYTGDWELYSVADWFGYATACKKAGPI